MITPIEAPRIEPLQEGVEVITTHANADFDAVASMIAAGKLYPNALMVFPGSQEKNLRNFFIQSVIYLFNVARIKDIDFKTVKRLILVDTRQASRIGALQKALDNEGLSIHIYDHHPEAPDDLKGEIELWAPLGSNAAIMTEILYSKGIAVSPEEATVLALGIYEDTGSFTFNSTTPRDLMAAAYLLEQGADLNVVAELTSRELSTEQVALLYEMINSAEMHKFNGIEIIITQASSETYIDELAVLVHKMMEMQSIPVLLAMVQMEGRVYFVARSRLTQVDVGEIARILGGGGHPSAAAATLRNMPIAQAVDKVLGLLPAALGPVRTARDIMVHPVISIEPEALLSEALKLLVRYNINVLLVISNEGEVRGYITRQDVGKAIHHGLVDYPVSEFVNTEIGSVGPEATFAEIQDLIVERKQRLLPVMEKGRAVGVITRTDLLNVLTSETQSSELISEKDEEKTGHTKQIRNMMRERLPGNVLALLEQFGKIADGLSFRAYVVGGFVRDILLRQENWDIDIVIEGDAIEFAEAFAAGQPGVRVRTHRKFKTAVMIFPEGFKADITTARREYYEYPGALPTVEKGSLRMDLFRRDFTINTLAISLNGKDFGTIIDYFHGLRDLKEGYIRILHNLSFVEDPTRVFRAIRFEQRFGFKIGKLTVSLIQNAIKHQVFEKLSGKRLLNEIRLIMREEDPGAAVMRMAEFELLKFIHPQIRFGKNTIDLFRRIKKVRDWFDLTYSPLDYQPWLVYFLALIDGLTREDNLVLTQRLSPKKHERHVLVEEKPLADRTLSWLSRNDTVRPSKIHIALQQLSIESALYLMAKSTQEDSARAIADYYMKIKHLRPIVNGEDLIRMGFQPGPIFKTILQSLLEARLDGDVVTKPDEEKFVLSRFRPDSDAEVRS